MATDFDSPWKEALEIYFQAFLALLFPSVHEQIDWSRGYESLDKEFQQLTREADLGRRYVDKLFKVWLNDGTECWMLIHVEVQTSRDVEFPKRMYVYSYRIFDRYNKPVASLEVLADDEPNWRPDEFRQSALGCEVGLRFPTVKLLDFEVKADILEASENPFAKVVLAHLKARLTHGDPVSRHAWKLRLVRGLFERGFGARDVRELFRVIDWMMELPPALETVFWDEIVATQKENHMPFVTTPERVGRRAGIRRGIEVVLRLRFGEEGLKLMPEIQNIHEEAKLDAILTALETAKDLDEIRLLWSSDTL